ncbi:hypothetical protein CHISP_3631 [Chitinispirillum alkaliphilum]|nr:hypothetical protein CHISP_3631 [Chitinispirillum alkaliphilum]
MYRKVFFFLTMVCAVSFAEDEMKITIESDTLPFQLSGQDFKIVARYAVLENAPYNDRTALGFQLYSDCSELHHTTVISENPDIIPDLNIFADVNYLHFGYVIQNKDSTGIVAHIDYTLYIPGSSWFKLLYLNQNREIQSTQEYRIPFGRLGSSCSQSKDLCLDHHNSFGLNINNSFYTFEVPVYLDKSANTVRFMDFEKRDNYIKFNILSNPEVSFSPDEKTDSITVYRSLADSPPLRIPYGSADSVRIIAAWVQCTGEEEEDLTLKLEFLRDFNNHLVEIEYKNERFWTRDFEGLGFGMGNRISE